MPKQKYVEKNRRMCIRSKEKKDGKTVKTTKARSNFTFKPTIQVLGPKNGYIVQIKVFCNCFLFLQFVWTVVLLELSKQFCGQC